MMNSWFRIKRLTDQRSVLGKNPPPPSPPIKSTTLSWLLCVIFFSGCFYKNILITASLHAVLAAMETFSFRFLIRFGTVIDLEKYENTETYRLTVLKT